MNKKLLVLLSLSGAAGMAQAQTSVTIYGSYDAGLRDVSHFDSAGDSRMSMDSTGTYNSNRLGFKGNEDLGGGMKAYFDLESGFNSGTGALDVATTQFNRQSYVGIGGNWGQVSFGRQNTVSFKTWGVYEPLNYKFPSITGMTALHGLGRFNNDIQYTGVFDTLTVRAEYSPGEQAGSSGDGTSEAVGVVYTDGIYSAGTAYTRQSNLIGTLYANATDWTIGGAVKFGEMKAFLGYSTKTQKTGLGTPDTDLKDAWTGLSYDITPLLNVTAAYYRTAYSAATGNSDGRKGLFIVGAAYALSKRTNLYADIDNAGYSGTAVGTVSPIAQSSQTGISVGINHLF